MDSYVQDPGSDTLRRLFRASSFLTPDLITAPPSWLGHLPFAFWITDALRPGTFVELGTHTGNSYMAFCQAVSHLGLPTACFAVDTWEGDPQAGYYGDEIYNTLAAHHDARYAAFSRLMRMTFDAAVLHFPDGGVDLLHIDGLHTYEAVRHDFETWRAKLSRRGVVLFHDINVRKDDFGVWRLWDELSRAYPSFSFLHSNGLGVLGVGEDLPDAVRTLFDVQAAAGEELQAVRGFFERLGQSALHAETIRRLERQEQHLRSENAMVRKVLDDQIAHSNALQEMIAVRDRDIGIIQGWVRDHEAEIGRLRDDHERLLAAHDAETAAHAAEAAAEIAARDQAIGELQALVAQKERQIAGLYTSTSWKLSAPVRLLGRIRHETGRVCRRQLHRMTMEPLHDLKPTPDGGYESTGGDPAFLVRSDRGRLPCRWCLISYTVVHASAPLSPILYVDAGGGFDERTMIRMPVDTAGEIRQLALLPQTVKALRFDPATRPLSFKIVDFTIREIGKSNLLLDHIRRNHPLPVLAHLWRHGWQATKQRVLQEVLPDRAADYETWIRLYDTLGPEEKAAIKAHIGRLARHPLISVVMPVYNTPETYLREALDSVLEQLYPDWELCIADDASTAPHVGAVLAEYQARDARIKVVRRATNGHISAASNSALELASGEFVALMDHDDRLTPHALYMVAAELNRSPDADILYSDEDKIDAEGRRYDPHFKSDFNLDLLHGQNMINHLGVFRRSVIERVGGFRMGFEGSQDYDLTLRAVEATTPDRIRHIPAILYHWRVFAESAAFSTVDLPRATAAAHRALTEHFQRRGVQASVETSPSTHRFTRIRYALPDPLPRVSLIVPTRDKVGLLKGCVDGLLLRTDYPDLEIIIVDNNSEEAKTLAYFDTLKDEPRVRVLRYEAPFNYSSINNFAAAQATGSVIGLVNNDIDVIEPGWLKEMVAHALRPEVGAVGAKLYYADGTVQHAGVITGIRGVAGHGHKGLAPDAYGYFSRAQLTQNLSCVTAACLIMRRAVFDEIGGLDEKNLAVAFNDVDFCLRIREAGYLVVWTPFAELYHLESASRGPDTAPDKVQRFNGEVSYMRRRWGDTLTQDPYYNPNLTLDAEDFGLAFPPRAAKPWFHEESC